MTYTTYPAYTVSTLAQAPHLQSQIEALYDTSWPWYISEFMRENAEINHYWTQLYKYFADYQILVCDSTQTLIALGHTIPVKWDQTIDGLPTGWQDALKQGIDNLDQQPNSLSGLAAVVHPRHQKKGLSQVLIDAMKKIATDHQLGNLIVPVRPILKHHYPLISMEQYVNWQQLGLPFDPWIRAHTKLGADILCVASASMVILASISRWRYWTSLRFPGSGSYIVPGALQPITIDCEQDFGIYQEASVWMRHPIGGV